MKKIAIVTALGTIVGFTGLAQAASTGTINFKGELTASTCEVKVDGQAADASVNLPVISASQLDQAGKTAGRTRFFVALENCQGTLKTASVFFESGAAVDSVTGRLNNSAGNGKAANVSLQLLDGSSSSPAIIQAGNKNQVNNTTYLSMATGGRASLPYAVEYYAENAVTAGKVASSVIYSIQYK